MSKPNKILFLFFALGFFSLFSQTIIIREFIISFGGNELGIGLFCFFWLFWVGTGALLVLTFLGKFLDRHFLKLLFLYPLLSFTEIIFFIQLRSFAHISWWEFFTLEKVFLYLFVFTSFISLFTGIIFTLGIIWVKKIKEEETAKIIGSCYIFESLGSFFAGSLVTFFIIKLFPPSLIITSGSLIFTFVILIVSSSFKDKISFVLNIFLFFIFLTFFFFPQKINTFFHKTRTKNLLPQAEFVEEIYTPYQHLFLGKMAEKLIVVSNGEILSTIPEIVDADKESALFMAESDFAKKVLIFGWGAENLIASLLKFPIDRIIYCLEDRVYYETIQRNLSWGLKSKLKDERLKVVFDSPRLFLRRNNEKFDLVIIYTSDPSNLVINTFFTKDFYQLVKKNMKEKAVLVTRITSSENFLGEEIRNYGSSLYYTLREVFPRVVITPGKINWFFASQKGSSLTEDPFILEKRLKKFVPSVFSFPPSGFHSIFIKERIDFIKKLYVDNPLFKNFRLINKDLHPLTFFLNLLVLLRYSNLYLVKFFKSAFLQGIYILGFILFIFLFLRLHFLIRVENIKNKRLVFNTKLFQFLSGFLGFSLHILLIFLFQNKFGTIFQLIGLVNSLFMLGLSVGGVLGRFFIKKIDSLKAIVGVLILQIIIVFLIYPLFLQISLPSFYPFSIFIFFFLLEGIVTGTSYPLSAKILEENKFSPKKIAVYLETLDHWGGALGGLISTLFMFPLLGIKRSLLIIFLITFLLLLLFGLEIFPLNFIKKEKRVPLFSFPYLRTSYILFAVSIIFIFNSFLLEKKRMFLDKEFTLKKDDCTFRKFPYPVWVCKKDKEKEYLLDSKDYAPGIKGFSGPIHLLIRIDKERKIKEIKVIKHKETPSYVKNLDKFLEQFKGRLLEEKLTLKDIDAISGATVTSSAIIEIVNEVGSKIKGKRIKRKIVFDFSTYLLLSFVFVGVVLYFLNPPFWLRKIYLILGVIFLGFRFNLIFSPYHLSNLLNFNFSSPAFLSLFLIHLLPIFLGILLGGFWCGWLCPFGSLQEVLNFSRGKMSSSLNKKARYFKYIFLVIFIVVISIQKNAYLFKQEPLNIFFLYPFKINIDKILGIVALLFSLFFLRFWCRYFCLCGAFLSLFNKFYLFKKITLKKYKNCPLGVDKSYSIDCIQCNLCLKDEKGR